MRLFDIRPFIFSLIGDENKITSEVKSINAIGILALLGPCQVSIELDKLDKDQIYLCNLFISYGLNGSVKEFPDQFLYINLRRVTQGIVVCPLTAKSPLAYILTVYVPDAKPLSVVVTSKGHTQKQGAEATSTSYRSIINPFN